MTDSVRVLCCVMMLLAVVGCDLVDPMRPAPHADTDTFGNLIEAVPDPSEDGVWIATIRAGVPRALGRAEQAPPTPDVSVRRIMTRNLAQRNGRNGRLHVLPCTVPSVALIWSLYFQRYGR